MGEQESVEARKLLDKLTTNEAAEGKLVGIVATTYECDPHFVETDWLPSILGLGLWDDRNWTSRIALEKALARTDGISLLIDARCVKDVARPLSYRIESQPAIGRNGQMLHAKVTVLVYQRAVRLVVASANLTPAGYRKNREVASVLVVTEKRPDLGPLVRSALEAMPEVVRSWWTPTCDRVRDAALSKLEEWAPKRPVQNAWFAWSGHATPLHEQVLARWDESDRVRRISVVSPFWSNEDGHGPLARLVRALRERGFADSELSVDLYAEADLCAGNRPKIPGTLAAFDTRALGVSARVTAVDPCVLEAEILRKDFTGMRGLHAKIVLFEGVRTHLAYWGSANFTGRGWGYEPVPNLEAGLIVREGARSSTLRGALLPPSCGAWISLDGAAAARITATSVNEDEPAWPSFLRSVRLCVDPGSPARLALRVEVDRTAIEGPWSLTRSFDGAPAVVAGFRDREASIVALDAATLNGLMRDREVTVRWWACAEGRAYPINVDLDARDELPIAPDAAQPTEASLLSYFQGKITWEDLFPPPSDDAEGGAEAPVATTQAGVDTSKIQSYVVRDFVEALAGIRSELRQGTESEPAMRQAVKGPVSAVALAQQIFNAVESHERTPVAAAFALVELLDCLNQARTFPVADKLHERWKRILDEGCTSIETLLAKVKAREVPAQFQTYERALRGAWRAEAT